MSLITLGLGGSPVDGTTFWTVLSATPLAESASVQKVRIVMSTAVLHSDPNARIDALNPHNYIFSGGLVASSVNHVSGGTTFDVYLNVLTTPGTTYNVKVINVETAAEAPPDPVGLQDTAVFTGLTVSPDPASILIARTVDARTVEIIFEKQVVQDQALNPANYSITPSLTIEYVTRLSKVVYRLHTSRQTVGTSYTVNVSNIYTE